MLAFLNCKVNDASESRVTSLDLGKNTRTVPIKPCTQNPRAFWSVGERPKSMSLK